MNSMNRNDFMGKYVFKYNNPIGNACQATNKDLCEGAAALALNFAITQDTDAFIDGMKELVIDETKKYVKKVVVNYMKKQAEHFAIKAAESIALRTSGYAVSSAALNFLSGPVGFLVELGVEVLLRAAFNGGDFKAAWNATAVGGAINMAIDWIKGGGIKDFFTHCHLFCPPDPKPIVNTQEQRDLDNWKEYILNDLHPNRQIAYFIVCMSVLNQRLAKMRYLFLTW